MATSALRAPPSLLRAWERYGRYLPRVAEVVLVVLLAHAAAILMWQAIPAPPGAAWKPPAATVDPASMAANHGPNVEMIAGAHLFGQYQAPVVDDVASIEDAQESNLDLTLMGILAATAERGSRALISNSSGLEKSYAIGDDVKPGVTLNAIFPDRVMLLRNAKLEVIYLNKDAGARGAPAGLKNFRKPAPSNDDEEDSGSDDEDDTASQLSDIRQELMNDPSKASEYIRVQPASNGGQLHGYRIYPGRDRTVFTSVGLRPGDLVTQVNGIQLNDANTALQMLQQLSQANNLTVVIERGGQQQTVNVNLN